MDSVSISMRIVFCVPQRGREAWLEARRFLFLMPIHGRKRQLTALFTVIASHVLSCIRPVGMAGRYLAGPIAAVLLLIPSAQDQILAHPRRFRCMLTEITGQRGLDSLRRIRLELTHCGGLHVDSQSSSC